MLSVVILTCNSEKHIQACLDSVFRQGAKDIEILVVDNASSDETREIIRRLYPAVKLIENPENFGTSKARNQGIGCSSGEWILALDSDVVLRDGFIEQFEAVRGQLADDTGMIQPNILTGDGKAIYSQGIHLTALRRFHDLNQGKAYPPQNIGGSNSLCKSRAATLQAHLTSRNTGKIIGPCSAAAFYRRGMLESLKEPAGYFDERFFFLVEDVDLAWRAERAGWKVRFFPDMVCFHSGNGSKTGRHLRQYLCFRNRRLMIAKNDGPWRRLTVHILSLPYEVARLLALMMFNRFFWKGAPKISGA